MSYPSRVESIVVSKGLHIYALSLRGKLEPGWAGALCNGLARLKVSIRKVAAVRDSRRNWDASVEMDFAACAVPPDAVDYTALAAETVVTSDDLATVVLTDYQIEPSRRCDGSLYLEIAAHDRLGLLSSLLNTFCLFSLFPAEMQVETNGRHAFGRFWLKGVAGTVPSRDTLVTLKDRLDTLLIRRGE